MRFQDKPSGSICRDELNQHEQMERSLYPNADPGDPDAGKRIDDESEPMPSAVAAILAQAKTKIQALGYVNVNISFEAEPVESAPIEDFKKASDARYNPGFAAARAKIGDTTKMTPMQRFKALSNLRWGL